MTITIKNPEEFEKEIRKQAERVFDKKYMKLLQKKIVQPRLKEVMQDEIKDVVLSENFVDRQGRTRWYRKSYGQGVGKGVKRTRPHQKGKGGGKGTAGRQYVELGVGRTQNRTFKPMADDRFMKDTEEKDTLFVYNNFDAGTSIFGTEIKKKGDEHLYTSWLVGYGHNDGKSNIVMPNRINKDGDYVENWSLYRQGTDKGDYKKHWEKYVKDRKNRYDARNYVATAKERVKSAQFKKEIASEIKQEIIKRILKKLQ